MRLLIEFGYVKVLFPKDCDYSKVIEAVAQSQVVEEKGPWEARVYVSKPDDEVAIKMLADDCVKLPDVSRSTEVEKIIALVGEKAELQSKVYELEAKLKKVSDVTAESKA